MKNLESLKRSVVNKNGFFCLSTEPCEGVTYAFYLRHKNGTEKVFYKPSAECLFDVPFDPGSYTAIFFYQKNKERKSFQDKFRITEKREIIRANELLLGEESGWKINYYENESDVTFVVFNGAGATKKSSPFGLSYLLGKGYNVVACLQDNDNYQSLSLEDFRDIVRPIVDGKEVFLYGSSLGGYCAIYYAGVINGTVISAAPRNPGHPALIDNFYNKFSSRKKNFRHNNIIENIKTKKDVYIFLDPYIEIDSFFMDNFIRPVYPNLKQLTFNHAGHEVLFHVNKTNQLDKIITSIVSGESAINIDSSVESCYSYRGKARYFLNKKNYEKAVYFSEKSLMDKSVSEKTRLRFNALHEQAVKRLNKK